MAEECKFCLAQHPEREMCDPAKRVLDALLAEGMSFNLPTLEFPEPVYTELGDPGDTYIVQFVVYAAVVEVAGVARPTLIFSGRDHSGKPLPRWIYPCDNQLINETTRLVADMGALAKRKAAEIRAKQGGST